MNGPQEKRRPAQRPGVMRKLAGWARCNCSFLAEAAVLLTMATVLLLEVLR